MNFIGLNGAVCAAEEAVVSVRDHGFLYGMGLFETFRTYKGKPFLLERHLKRLEAGCRELGIPYQGGAGQLAEWIASLMAANGLEEAYIRYTVTAGEDLLGLPSGDYRNPNRVLFAKALPPAVPVRDAVLLHTVRNTPEAPVRRKSLHYMNSILGKRELNLHPASSSGAEGLMLTQGGHVAEGVVSNVFWVREGKLYTPDVSAGILPGITREMVLELAGQAGIEAETGLYDAEYLMMAEEMFITGSVQGITPVTGVWTGGTRKAIGRGAPGPITLELQRRYNLETGEKP
ncbi:aminotransferase class IV [Paenibacillus glufosinatiresistens]|uniref:aminotransferase class IV n=1 Tax=Paenibacillus glufosinatiresistens TaxID=3070657 RepID=UPI00286DD1F0|nr:aminotransferase class IV [Paenibacillus sp. YX.27]